MIHPTADVQSQNIGEYTRIWQNVVILPGAIIGNGCNISAQCFIENDVIIGDNVTIKCGVYLWDGIRIGDDVFIGPNVTFTNDKFPRSKQYPENYQKTVIRDGASLGAGSVILSGITIGEYSMIGAGSVVTKNIPSFTLWYGNPAQHKGFVTKSGIVLTPELKDKEGRQYHLLNDEPLSND